IDYSQLSQFFQSNTLRPTSFYHLGVYGQDEWHVRPGLTLTAALRAEHQSNLVCETRCFARLTGPFNAVSHDPNQPYNHAILIGQKRSVPKSGQYSLVAAVRFRLATFFGVRHNTVMRGGIGIFCDSVNNIAPDFAYNPPFANSFAVTGDVLSPSESQGSRF